MILTNLDEKEIAYRILKHDLIFHTKTLKNLFWEKQEL